MGKASKASTTKAGITASNLNTKAKQMSTYEEIAPELSDYITEEAATNFAENLLNAPTVTYRELSDLTALQRNRLFQWLKWFGRNRKPTDLNESSYWSPKRVATNLGMSREYLMTLVAERNAIVAEVNQWDGYAFLPHTPAVITDVNVDGYGDITITGTTMFSQSDNETIVNMTRPGVASIDRTQTQIEANGGSVTDTEIIIISGTFPGNLQTNDEITITANELISDTYIIQ